MGQRSTRAVATPPQSPPVGGWVGAGALVAFALTVVALFLPFANLTCASSSCPPSTSTHLLSGDLLGGMDGWRLLTLGVAALATCACYLALSSSRRQASLGAVVLALATAVLVLVDVANASSRVLGWPGQAPRGVAHDQGFYLALAGALAAVLFSALMVRSQRPSRA
jgi:hypothetical protein